MMKPRELAMPTPACQEPTEILVSRRHARWTFSRLTLIRIYMGAMAAITAMAGGATDATEIIRWQRQPIQIELHVGQERIVVVDRAMRVGVPPTLAERLRVQSADGALYLLAKDTFPATRVELQDADTGNLVFLDVHATQSDTRELLEPVRILLTKAPADDDKSERPSAETSREEAREPAGLTPTAMLLTRYAAQNFYAPLRTVESVPGITPTQVHPTLDLSALLPILPVNLNVLGAWRLEDEWVTALRVTNQTSTWQSLDPRTLQGDFVAATFQHRQLGPRGESTDTTVLYLITRGHGLAESLLPAISPVDANRNVGSPAPSGDAHEK